MRRKGLEKGMKKPTMMPSRSMRVRKLVPPPGVEAALLAHVLHGEGQVVLIAEDGFVLGAVVLEGAVDVRYPGHQHHVAQEDGDAQKALEHGAPAGDVRRDRALQQVEEHRGQQEEQEDGQGHPQHPGDAHDDAGELIPQVVGEPLVQLAGLLFLAGVLGDLVRGEGEGFVAQAEGVDEGEDAPDKGLAQDGGIFW